MKLLLDANLSRRSVPALENAYPGSRHVSQLTGQGATPDATIFDVARTDGFALVTKDTDFLDLSLRFGRPPLIILVLSGNGSRQSVEALLLTHQPLIETAYGNHAIAVVELE